MLNLLYAILGLTICVGCYSQQQVFKLEADESLDEISAIEITNQSDHYWVIQDAGNNNFLYGLNKSNGKIDKEIEITNAENEDWEDITKDEFGNLYIGDIGSNSEDRENFTIYKIKADDLHKEETKAEVIKFELPEKKNNKNFEAFYLFKGNFYLFSKEEDVTYIYKLPNQVGKQQAKFIKKIKLKAKNSKVTSADISPNGNKVILLNHERIWILNNFNSENFSYSYIDEVELNSDTQKEGLCFKDTNTILMSDERNDDESFIYTFKL